MAILQADGQGTIRGKFKIPANIKAGTKQLKFYGDKSSVPGSQSHAETTFTGQGTVVTNTMRQVKNVMQSYYDPLAQTFMLDNPRQLSGVDLMLITKGTTPLIVQLRETSVGFPTRTIIAEGRLAVGDMPDMTGVPAGQGKWVSIEFDEPFYASANIEYAVVVLANDANTAVGISELGKRDLVSNSYVTTQPYQVGVLLSSANASTWTAHQDKDLTFKLRARKYTGMAKSIELGIVTLPKDTTDLLISALTTTPATSADADLLLTYPGGKDTQTVSDGQVIKFGTAYSAAADADRQMMVVANLRCTETASATIAPGTQIIAGVMADSGTYITRDIPCNNTKEANITVTLEALNPGAIEIAWAAIPQGGVTADIPAGSWHALTPPQANQITLLRNGRNELVYTNPTANKIPATPAIKLKVTLHGSANNRPMVFNLRASIVSTN